MRRSFSQVPDWVLDMLQGERLPGAQCSVILCLIQASFGWNEGDTGPRASYGAIEAKTGLSKASIRRAIRALQGRGIVRRTAPPAGTRPASYAVQDPGSRVVAGEHPGAPRVVTSEHPRVVASEYPSDPRVVASEHPPVLTSEYSRVVSGEHPLYIRDKTQDIAPPTPPRIDIDTLRQRLGLRGLVPPIQHELWVGISQQPQEAIDAALEKAAGKANPGAYFLALFTKTGEAKPDLRDDTGDDGYPAFLPGETERENSERAFAKVDFLNYEL